MFLFGNYHYVQHFLISLDFLISFEFRGILILQFKLNTKFAEFGFCHLSILILRYGLVSPRSYIVTLIPTLNKFHKHKIKQNTIIREIFILR